MKDLFIIDIWEMGPLTLTNKRFVEECKITASNHQ